MTQSDVSICCQIEEGNEQSVVPIAETVMLPSACRAGHVEHVRDLIVNGADVNTTQATVSFLQGPRNGMYDCFNMLILEDEHHGRSALMLAAEGGHVECVRILVEAGADINARSKVGCRWNGKANGRGPLGL